MKYLIPILVLFSLAGCRNSPLFYSKVENSFVMPKASVYNYNNDKTNYNDVNIIMPSSVQYNVQDINQNQSIDFNDNKKIILKLKK